MSPDDILAPDPRPWEYRRHDHYQGVTNERAFELAHRRHLADLARRKADVDNWDDYPARTVRLPWTHRQQRLALAYLLACCLLMLVGWLRSPIVFGGAVVASWPVAALAVRDLWWRFEAWLGWPLPTPIADARAKIESWLYTEEEK